jgi:hypothetical protein
MAIKQMIASAKNDGVTGFCAVKKETALYKPQQRSQES